jgi:hypothetical protein
VFKDSVTALILPKADGFKLNTSHVLPCRSAKATANSTYAYHGSACVASWSFTQPKFSA